MSNMSNTGSKKEVASKLSLDVLMSNEETPDIAQFIENSINGTIFHRPKFLSYHSKDKYPQGEYATLHLVFRSKGKIVGFMPGMIHAEGNERTYLSPCGASFGGLVVSTNSFDKCDAMMDMAKDHILVNEKVDKIRIIPPTSAYCDGVATDTLYYLYLSKGFTIRGYDLTMVTEIVNVEDFPRMVLKDRVRSALSQSRRKNVECRISQDAAIAYPIIEADQKKFGKKPTHTLVELERLSQLFPDKILYFLAYKDDRPIAAVALIICNERTCYTFYIDQLEEFSDARPVDLLLCEVLDWMKKNGFKRLDFGPSTFGSEPHKPLIFFKEGFGSGGILRYVYELKHRRG